MSVNVIIIEVVGRCLATCNYCPQGLGVLPVLDSKDSLITPEILDKALFLAKKGRQKIIFLHHRGEPFLHPDLDKIIAKIREAGFLACLSTNLIVATEEKLDKVLRAGINQLEVHYSGGRTILSHDELLKKIHLLRKMNWSIRNNGCRIEINYALQECESEESIRKEMSTCSYYDETMCIKFYSPHNWSGLMHKQDLGINPFDCEWYTTKSCSILCNGDIVICCLDQWGYSKKVNIMNIDEIAMEFLSERVICKGCLQHDWFNDWLNEEILKIPNYLARRLDIDSLEDNQHSETRIRG